MGLLIFFLGLVSGSLTVIFIDQGYRLIPKLQSKGTAKES